MRYAEAGYNLERTMDGIPTKETLDKLGMGYVSEDFLRRGILTDDEKN